MNESQIITSKNSKLQKNVFNISFMLSINMKNSIIYCLDLYILYIYITYIYNIYMSLKIYIRHIKSKNTKFRLVGKEGGSQW